MFENKRIKTQLVLFYNATEEGYEDYMREFYSAAKQLLGEVYCLKANLATSDRLLKYFGIFQNPTSAIVVFVCSHSRQSFVERSHGRRIPEEVPISRSRRHAGMPRCRVCTRRKRFQSPRIAQVARWNRNERMMCRRWCSRRSTSWCWIRIPTCWCCMRRLYAMRLV